VIGLDAVLLGGALIPVGLWGLTHWGAASTSTILLAFQVGLNLPHYFQTYGLTYLNPEVRRSAALRLWTTLAAAIALPVTAILLGPTALRWTLAFIALWAFLHITQQTRGLVGLYLRRAGDGGPALRQPLLAFLFLSTAAVAAYRIASHGLTLAGEPFPLARPVTLVLVAAATAALGLAFGRATRAHVPALALSVTHTAVMALSMSVDNLSLALALATSWHALQYLGLTFTVQRQQPESLPLARLARTEVVAFFGVAIAFGFAAAGIGAALPSPWGQAVYLPLLLVHYLNDAWLWRPQTNPRVRAWLAPLVSRGTRPA
jgi:hypothetical protein